ncbi:hypothetical protein KP79_PYT14971 [Mizuhopecten yessoensis]|uniref:Uncharacterized protein n=1 Tax=Mizuhopecten yessoensis TaxID=6573 RepID=A0A210QDU2_MIZYE|nr:hypothetical protein KP79_PYT14971 [Mizuhopecten yessoensis]
MYDVAPNINESIACFLSPAGMVYAVSFGFAFQQVLGKQTDVMKNIAHDVRQMNQLISMTKSLRCISHKTRIKMYTVLKAEVLTMMRLFMQVDTKGNDKEDQEVDIWCIIDLLRETKSPNGDIMDDAICGRFVKYLGCLRNLNRDILHSKMHFLEWALLETLGYFTFLGILMVQAQSYRLELTMCIITVLSITMLCYIVADLDNPLHGFFRIDLTQIETLIERLERMYITAISADNVKEEVKHIPGNDVKKQRRLPEQISFFGNVYS